MTLQNKVSQFSADADLAHAIIHGPASGAGSTVDTEGGPVRTFAKIDADTPSPKASIAVLRAYAGTATAAQVTHRTSGGTFLRDDADATTADDGGIVIVDALGRRWKRMTPWPANARWFGAVGDGVTDDTSALQAWLDYGRKNGAACVLPAGKYRTSATLSVNYTDATKWAVGFKIYGESPAFDPSGTGVVGSVIAPTNAVVGAALEVIGAANADNSNRGQVNGLTVESIGVQGVSGGTNGDGFRFKYFTNLTLRNLWVANCADAISLERQANGANFGYGFGVTVERLFAVSCRGWGVNMLDAGAITVMMSDPNITVCAGGINAAGSPLVCYGGYIGGCTGPALVHDDPTGVSSIFGPVFHGTRFESNNASTLGPQVRLISSTNAMFDSCWFLTSTDGEHGVEMGEDAVKQVRFPCFKNCLFMGRGSITTQRAFLVGANAFYPVVENCRFTNFTSAWGGTVGMPITAFYRTQGSEIGSRMEFRQDDLTARAWSLFFQNETQPRLSVNIKGDHNWGDGTAAPDALLTRDAANRLAMATGDSFRITDANFGGGKLILGANRVWCHGTTNLPRINVGGDPASDQSGTPMAYKKLTGTTAAAVGATVTVAHGLGYAPSHVVVSSRGAGAVYQAASADATNVTIAGTAASLPFDVYVG